jgi:ribosome-associated toxin RatA of RatAB toxin-antitoxin module
MEARTPVERTHVFRDASPREVYDVVVDFAAYARLFREFKQVRVIEQTPERARVEFRAEVLLPLRYVLELRTSAEALTVDWTFVEGEVVTDATGGWRFAPEGPVAASGVAPHTRADYRASVSVKAPLPGFLVRKATDALVAASLPGMFASIDQELRRRQQNAPAP